jgi:hypothetical protein
MSYSIEKLILIAAPALSGLRTSLVQARDALVQALALAPDFAASINARIADLDAKIAILDSTADAAGLATLGVAVVKELAALPKEGLKPTFHPGDVTGG